MGLMPMRTDFWTKERIATLERLWAHGKSAGTIAKALGGISRSAVLGKIFRLRLGDVPKSAAKPRPEKQRRAKTATQAQHKPRVKRSCSGAPAWRGTRDNRTGSACSKTQIAVRIDQPMLPLAAWQPRNQKFLLLRRARRRCRKRRALLRGAYDAGLYRSSRQCREDTAGHEFLRLGASFPEAA